MDFPNPLLLILLMKPLIVGDSTLLMSSSSKVEEKHYAHISLVELPKKGTSFKFFASDVSSIFVKNREFV